MGTQFNFEGASRCYHTNMRPLSFFSPSSLPPWPMLRQTQPFSTVATHMLSVPMVLMGPMVLTVPTPTIHTPIPAAAMLPAQLFHVLTTMSSRGKPRLRLTLLPSSTLTLTVATTVDLVPIPTPMATATPTLPTHTPVAATMPALLSHAPTVLLPPTLLPRGRPTPTQPTLSAPTLLNTDSQGPFTETVWSTPL